MRCQIDFDSTWTRYGEVMMRKTCRKCWHKQINCGVLECKKNVIFPCFPNKIRLQIRYIDSTVTCRHFVFNYLMVLPLAFRSIVSLACKAQDKFQEKILERGKPKKRKIAKPIKTVKKKTTGKKKPKRRADMHNRKKPPAPKKRRRAGERRAGDEGTVVRRKKPPAPKRPTEADRVKAAAKRKEMSEEPKTYRYLDGNGVVRRREVKPESEIMAELIETQKEKIDRKRRRRRTTGFGPR